MSARRGGRVGAVVLALPVLLAGCGVGTGTLRIADAEREIVAIAQEIVSAVGLGADVPVAAAPLEQCALRNGGAGLRTRVEVREELPDGSAGVDAAFDAAAGVLVARELVLVESGVPGTLLAQRDGITVTIGSDGAVLELDALTGCRPR